MTNETIYVSTDLHHGTCKYYGEESRNLSQESTNCDKDFDNILKDSFRGHNRLHIAAMAMAGILNNQRMCDNLAEGETTPQRVFANIARTALSYADALIAEYEEPIK